MTHHMSLPSPPSLSQSLSELPRSSSEVWNLMWGLRSLVSKAVSDAQGGDGRPVLVLPGYGGSDGAMYFLRSFLDRLGYRTFRLNLGVNYEAREDRIKSVDDAIRFRESMVSRVQGRVQDLREETGEKVTLIGWSMGGLYAFDVGLALQEDVRMVITLGSPFGDPRSTSLFNALRWLNRSDVPIEGQNFDGWTSKAGAGENRVPIKVIYSKQDGIVSPGIARPPEHPSIECLEVSSSHIGFAVNLEAYAEIGKQLSGSSA